MTSRPKRAAEMHTGWLEARAEPVREGVYRRQWPAGPFSCWSQGQWYGDAVTPDAAARQLLPSRHQDSPWAGLSSAPEQPCWLCRDHGVIDRGIDADTGVDLIDTCPEC